MIKTENIGTEEKIMKAVLIKTNDRLEIGEVPMPDPNADDLLVQVKATAINRADILQRKGLYPPPKGEWDDPDDIVFGYLKDYIKTASLKRRSSFMRIRRSCSAQSTRTTSCCTPRTTKPKQDVG